MYAFFLLLLLVLSVGDNYGRSNNFFYGYSRKVTDDFEQHVCMWGEVSSLKTQVVTHPGATDAGRYLTADTHTLATAANHKPYLYFFFINIKRKLLYYCSAWRQSIIVVT